nr:hypothetical protein Iba_chr11bCG9220 [Ipomoea batatas]
MIFSFSEMVLEKNFVGASTGPKKPRPKVTLGRNKATQSTASASDQPGSAALPHGVDAAPTAADLQEGGEQTVNLLEKIQTIIPTREAIRDLETDQVGEMIAQNILWAAENVVRGEVNLLKESFAAKNKKLSEKVQVLEGRVAPAEREVEATKRETAEMNRKISDYASLFAFLCRDKGEAEAFFRAFIHSKGRERAYMALLRVGVLHWSVGDAAGGSGGAYEVFEQEGLGDRNGDYA